VNFKAVVPVTGTHTLLFIEDMHYYPFGMLIDGLGTISPANDYAYNGKELNEDFGLGLSDYGARWYDASIGRWGVVDPMASKTGSIYDYVGNNPLSMIDPTGMESEAYTNKLDELKAKAAVNSLVTMKGKARDVEESDIATSTSDPKEIEKFLDENYTPENITVGWFERSEFKERFKEDLKIILSTPSGKMMLIKLETSGYVVEVSEANAYSFLYNNAPTPMEDLLKTRTSLKVYESKGLDGTITKQISKTIELKYSQHWGVIFDGLPTQSFLTLAHELRHASDLSRTGRLDGSSEKSAVNFENLIRFEYYGSGPYRTRHHSEGDLNLPFSPTIPNDLISK
jgi:RHS repeat-associated protein